jgi:hypothetical protein
MGKKSADALKDDIRLIAQLVAKRLRDEHCEDYAPTRDDYRLVNSVNFVRAGAELHVAVDLGRGLRANVFDVWWKDGDHDLDTLLRHSEDLADTVAEMRRQASDVHVMLSEVRRVAKREIAKANRRGLPYSLVSADLLPVQAGTHEEAVVRVEHNALGCSLKSERLAFDAACAEDVTASFAGFAEEQTRRAARRAELDRVGATGTIDAVLVAALEAACFDVPQVLAALRDSEDWIVDVGSPDGKNPDDRGFRLHWNDGAVRSRVMLAEGIHWSEGKLHLERSPRAMDRVAAGTPLREVFNHPLIDERVSVLLGRGAKGGQATVYCREAMLNFNADSGRLWAA